MEAVEGYLLHQSILAWIMRFIECNQHLIYSGVQLSIQGHQVVLTKLICPVP